jgi:hypothetical protein
MTTSTTGHFHMNSHAGKPGVDPIFNLWQAGFSVVAVVEDAPPATRRFSSLDTNHNI